jgi:predicted transglutaminase-like cysteine proteinase
MFIAAAIPLLLGLTAQADLNEPFGRPTLLSTEVSLSATWQDLRLQIQSEQRIIAQCRTDPHSCPSPAALQFLAIVKAGDQYKGHARLGHINRAVNLAIRSVKASTVQTMWTSPLEALAAGFGDCKQIALLKYAALADAGFSPDDLRLVIVKIKALQNEPHAMIAVREDARWSILDSRTMAIVESTKLLGYYEPDLTLDHRGARRFVQPFSPVAALR